jgi:hypothetical protein
MVAEPIAAPGSRTKTAGYSVQLPGGDCTLSSNEALRGFQPKSHLCLRPALETRRSLLAFYESVRRQVVADDKLGGRRLAGATVKEYENRLKTAGRQTRARRI